MLNIAINALTGITISGSLITAALLTVASLVGTVLGTVLSLVANPFSILSLLGGL